MPVIKFNFIIVAIGSQTEMSFSHPLSSLGLGQGEGWNQETFFLLRVGPGHVNENLTVATSRLLLQSCFDAT